MTPLPTLRDLLARVEAATGPSRELDCMIWCVRENRTWRREGDRLVARHAKSPHTETFIGGWKGGQIFFTLDSYIDHFTASVDACIALAAKMLPGFAWRCGSCWLSDDAWVAPDFSSPAHRERLIAELGEPVARTVWDEGFNIDRRPAGNVPLAFLAAILRALIARAEKGTAI